MNYKIAGYGFGTKNGSKSALQFTTMCSTITYDYN